MTIASVIASLNATATASIVKRWQTQEPDGYLYVTPPLATLASESGCNVDEMALAALVASEVGNLPVQYMYAVAEVGINEAKARGISVASLLCGSPKPGHCGEQHGRWAATSRPPNARHLAAARAARAGVASGFVRGARKFFDGKSQDGGVQRGRDLAFDADGIVRKWYSEGNRWVGPITVPLIGTLIIDPYRLMLMGPDGEASLDEALAAIDDGRARWHTTGSDGDHGSRQLPDDGTSNIGGALIPALIGAAAFVAGKVLRVF